MKQVAIFLALAGAAFGQTYYVDSSATAGGNGLTEATAFDEIADVNAVLDGDAQTIYLVAGSTFTDAGLSLTDNDKVLKLGTGANPIIDGDGSIANGITSPSSGIQNVLVEDLTITGMTDNGVEWVGLTDNVIMRRCTSTLNAVNGFAHESATTAAGRVYYIDCTATSNTVDGFNNRGFARDVCIRCATSGHTGGASDDGYTTHNSSGFELWYCTSDGDDDAVHFTHDAAGDAYCKIVGCTFTNMDAGLGLNLGTSGVGGGISHTKFQGDSQLISATPGSGTTVVFDSCQFIGDAGGDMVALIDGSGAGTVVVRNSLLRMPDDTTQTSIYGIRRLSTGPLLVYNNTVIVPPDSTETANYFAVYQQSGTAGQVVNNVFLKTDEPNAYFIRTADGTGATYDLIDGNIYVQVTTNNSSWYINGSADTFANFQALDKGVSGAETDDSGANLANNPTMSAASYLGEIADWRVPVHGTTAYLSAINCAQESSITSKFSTSYGAYENVIRDGGAGGSWTAGPYAQTAKSSGSVMRTGRGLVFAGATLDGSWQQSYKLTSGAHDVGNFLKFDQIMGIHLTGSASIGVFIHAGAWGDDDEVVWSGGISADRGVSVLDQNALGGERYRGPAGKDLYVTFVGTGKVYGFIDALNRDQRDEPAASGTPDLTLKSTTRANR